MRKITDNKIVAIFLITILMFNYLIPIGTVIAEPLGDNKSDRDELESDAVVEEEEEEVFSLFQANTSDNDYDMVVADLGVFDLPDDQAKGNELAETLIGSGIIINNIDYVGVDSSAGFFEAEEEIIGFESGIILSTGDVKDVVGPNTLDDTSTNNGLTGDADLETLIPGYRTYDATVLEFDFIPTHDQLYFEYVFASEEYNEFVNSSYNDVFGFFVNGENVATIPGTDVPVSINNVNGGNPYGEDASHPELFRNNDLNDGGGDINTEMDGLTVVLPIQADVIPGQYNRIKLAIADAGDAIFDSNVFIKSGSFTGLASIISGIGAVENIKSQQPNFDGISIGVPISDPIDTATGAQVLLETLLSVHGAIPLEFDVTYNSLLLEEGEMGHGWSHNYEMGITETDDGLVVIHWDSNRISTFAEIGQGNYSSPDAAMKNYMLTKETNESFTLTSANNEVYKFNTDGLLTEKYNNFGQKVTLTYDNNDQLSKVTEPVSGQEIYFHYNGEGLLTKVSDKLDREVAFSYDGDNLLTDITDVLGTTRSFTYNDRDQLLTAVDSTGNQIFSNVHDEWGRVISQTDGKNQTGSFVYEEDADLGQLVTTYTDREGNEQLFVYNNRYQLISQTDELGYTVEMEYDNAGNLVLEKDENGNVTTYTYDDHGNRLTMTDALGNTSKMTYDSRNNLLTSENPIGDQVTFSYNSRNQIVQMIDPFGEKVQLTYNDHGLLTSEKLRNGGEVEYTYSSGILEAVTSPNGDSANFVHDPIGRIIGVVDEENYETSFELAPDGNILEMTDALGNSITYKYDPLGNLITETNSRGYSTHYEYDGNNNLIEETNALGQTISYTYDKEDRLASIKDAKGNKTSLHYDKKGQLIGMTNPLGNSIDFELDGVGNLLSETDAFGVQIAKYSYDAVGNLLQVKNALGNMESFDYDAVYNITGLSNALGHTTNFAHDALGRVVRSTDSLDGTSESGFDEEGNQIFLTDPNGSKLQFVYDQDGALTSLTSAAGYTVTYEHNARGLVTQLTNGRGQVTTYEYDETGRLVTLEEPNNTSHYTYDENGNVLTITDNLGTIHYDYDALDQLIAYTDVFGHTIEYSYDANGNVTTLTYPNGNEVTYEYNAGGQLVKVTDWENRTTSYKYDKNGRLLETARANGTVEQLSYNEVGQLKSSKDVNEAEEIVNHYSYTYDSTGNIISESNPVALTPSFETTTIKNNYTVGNQMASYNGENLSHDNDGNVTYGALNDEITPFNYDSRNRLVQAGETTYTYDANNHRVVTEDEKGLTKYVVNPNTTLPVVLMETDADGNITSSYVYGLGLIGYEDNSGEYYTYHQDFRGSTTALTDENGDVVARYMYDPFGNILAEDGDINQPYLYVGKYGVETDANGLVYMRARYYQPEMQRFLNEDIYVGEVVIGQSLNRYAYSQNNPVMMIDPDGEKVWVLAGGVVGSIYSVGGQVVSDVITGEMSDWQTYTGQAVGGFAGGATMAGTGNLAAASAATAIASNGVTQGLYYLTDKEQVNLGDAAINTATDFGLNMIGGKITSKLVPANNTLHNHKWANKVIKNYNTAFFGKTAQTELWKGGAVSLLTDVALDSLIGLIPEGGNSFK